MQTKPHHIYFIYNERHSAVQFSQRQVATVTHLLNDDVPFNDQRVMLHLAPTGV